MDNDISLFKNSTGFNSGCRVFYGLHAASAYLLNAAAFISAEQPLRLLDFGNRCDMNFTARQLRYLTSDPAAAMMNIRLQRAFTCYQAAALLRELQAAETGMPVIILDLLAPFLDENIKTAEVFRLYSESIALLKKLMPDHMILIGVKPVPGKLAPDRVRLVNNLDKTFGLISLPEPGAAANSDLPAGRFGRPQRRESDDSKGPALNSGQMSLFDLLP